MRLSIVIPAYNEAERLPRTLVLIRDFLVNRPETTEIIVVDDGSTDGTAETARLSLPGVRVISHERNLGKGAAVRTGMLAARGDLRYLCDADLSTPISEITNFIKMAATTPIVIGSRRAKGARVTKAQVWWKVLLGQFGNLAIQALAAPGIKDSQCGFKMFRSDVSLIFKQQRLQRWGYDFELIFLARKYGYRVQEIPVTWVNDERSKVTTGAYFRTFLELLQIRWNDLRGLYQPIAIP